MLTAAALCIQQRQEKPGHPVPGESRRHPAPDAEVTAEANIHCVLMHLHVCPWLLLMFLFWSISLVSIALLLPHPHVPPGPHLSLEHTYSLFRGCAAASLISLHPAHKWQEIFLTFGSYIAYKLFLHSSFISASGGKTFLVISFGMWQSVIVCKAQNLPSAYVCGDKLFMRHQNAVQFCSFVILSLLSSASARHLVFLLSCVLSFQFTLEQDCCHQIDTCIFFSNVFLLSFPAGIYVIVAFFKYAKREKLFRINQSFSRSLNQLLFIKL